MELPKSKVLTTTNHQLIAKAGALQEIKAPHAEFIETLVNEIVRLRAKADKLEDAYFKLKYAGDSRSPREKAKENILQVRGEGCDGGPESLA